MVNHLRSLLLNLASSPDAEGEELIEASFMPKTLTKNQSAVRNLIFPEKFSRKYGNFISTALTRIVMNSPFASDINALDSRSLLSDPVNAAQEFGSQITINPLTSASSLTVRGQILPNNRSGVFSEDWIISYASSSSVTILNPADGVPTTKTITFNEGSSSVFSINLEGSLTGQLLNVSAVPSGFLATVTAALPISYSIIDLARNLQLSSRVRSLMFIPNNETLSQKCLDYFESDSRPDLTVAAVLTAYAYSF